ncbi:hypothetical protein BKP37_17055 [Anaerobacillus alkalilacustris]|uniref:Uncharacterized protein n=1 Tax=Anaerobacillus alkalilacustris TaxID=393763 RepID=A0A1S2LED3_9BACI|nr:iron-containing alcohol dehydrogenase [Anaerobacillus alkalilacustris]OIJ10882.1 hypothetical protein BKP37_17055 [Anaerobacillus alkalilacustris]
MKYVLEVPQRIVTGWGTVSTIGSEVSTIGERVMVIHTKRLFNSSLIEEILLDLKNHGVYVICEHVSSGEPTVEQVEMVLKKVEEQNCDFVIGVGGGSVLDLVKAVAGLKFPNRKPVKDYFYGEKIPQKGIPWVAVPTTSGTGSEVTPNSVLSDEKIVKLSIRGDNFWLAKVVILDPQLTVSSPANVTAWSGMDALTQAVEAHTSKGANALTEPYSLKATTLIANSLMLAYKQPEDQKARTDMALGSLLTGVALANARLGIVHGVAHSIGLHFNVPHGLVCGTLLPWAIEYNQEVSKGKYKEIAQAIGIGTSASNLENWVRMINLELGIPYSIKEFGVTKEDLDRIVEESMPSGSLKANPRTTSREELYEFLAKQL